MGILDTHTSDQRGYVYVITFATNHFSHYVFACVALVIRCYWN